MSKPRIMGLPLQRWQFQLVIRLLVVVLVIPCCLVAMAEALFKEVGQAAKCLVDPEDLL